MILLFDVSYPSASISKLAQTLTFILVFLHSISCGMKPINRGDVEDCSTDAEDCGTNSRKSLKLPNNLMKLKNEEKLQVIAITSRQFIPHDSKSTLFRRKRTINLIVSL
jgi:hypothetical protein